MAGQRSRFMAVTVSWVLVVLVLAEMGCAQEPTPSPSSGGCDDTVSNLSPCLTYIMANDSTPPAKDCCSGFAKVVNGNIVCLCGLLGSSNNYGITINLTRAAALPAACKVKSPPISACAALAPSPTSSSSSGVGSPTAGSNTVTPGLSPSAATGAAGIFRPSPSTVFTALLLAGVAQVLI
ncbi:hypothetical protein SUGI_0072510 [Cryptomeria japonica]|uniref:non-specific lipid transfer protein GPI-anchored 31 n=1 Tax=Cryptomeria japonica TaxID=3369 RepID=UPI002408E34E|nr:non-specific lipid transfer protein GPI-anchored 31 [Cryptomeria japonica]GLJ07688.1 hypothetical protein SUGI_0072510 [Cryptomeria japonica]